MELTTEKFHEQDYQELQAVSVGTGSALAESHGPNHENPVREGAQDRVWDLTDQLADCEDVRRINPTRRLSDEDTPVEDPQGLNL